VRQTIVEEVRPGGQSIEFQRREAGNHRFACRGDLSRMELVAIDAEKTDNWVLRQLGSSEHRFRSFATRIAKKPKQQEKVSEPEFFAARKLS
jgi:hypothetical protein